MRLAFRLDRDRPSLGAMESFFSLGLPGEATRSPPFVQQIASSAAAPIAKVQTMPAEPVLRPSRTAGAAAGRCAAGEPSGRAPW
jgi:hypothetical protein